MKKKTLRKEIHKSFTSSWGRFFSILFLMILGSFALVGLKVTGPNMRSTGENYFNQYNLADITIIGDYGIDVKNQEAINNAKGIEYVEYGYIKDVVIKDTTTSFRIFSKSENVSNYELVEGRFPQSENEISISNQYCNEYKIGDTIEFSEEENVFGNTTLTNHSFEVVGFINSSEIISAINLGEATAGTGSLNGYAVVVSDVFDSDFYMIARLTFNDTEGVNPYSDEYTNLIQEHKDNLSVLLKDQPDERLKSIKEEFQNQIDDGKQLIEEAKQKLLEKEDELNNASIQLEEAKNQIENAEIEISNGKLQISEAILEINNKEQELNQQQRVLERSQIEYNNGIALLDQKKQELATAQVEIDAIQSEIDTKKTELENAKQQYEEGINFLEQQIDTINQSLTNSSITEVEKNELEAQLSILQAQLIQIETDYEQFLTLIYSDGIGELQIVQETLNSKKNELQIAQLAIQENETNLTIAKEQLDAGYSSIEIALDQINNVKTIVSKNQQILAEANVELETKEFEYKKGLEEFQEKSKEFQNGKIEAEKEIAENEDKLNEAIKSLDKLKAPMYSVSSRRETYGSEGYKIYDSVSKIIDSLANIFPIFLYFVAALVTFTTMTRYVDEERTNSGILKALGYNNKDIIKKFTLYGLISSMLGSIIGIILGHTLLPLIVNSAYYSGFTLPQMDLQFNWEISVLSLLLAFISAVVPAYVAAKKELSEKPIKLLSPKPPTDGSKIFLEYITVIWKRMSFTHKVTARNIFRYKKRMFMTIFGVCGSVALLFTGLGVQRSISGVSQTQFGEIIHYDLIVAQNDNLNENQQSDINKLLNSDNVEKYSAIYFEELSKTAGNSNDKQVIKLIVPEDEITFADYITLSNRQAGDPTTLKDDGAVISERLAELLDVNVGSTITKKMKKI